MKAIATVKLYALRCGCLLCALGGMMLLGSLFENLTPSPGRTTLQLAGIILAGVILGKRAEKQDIKISRCAAQHTGPKKGCMTMRNTNPSRSFYHGAKEPASGAEPQQQSLTDMMEGLTHKQRVGFCLYKIADLCGRDEPLKVQELWPTLTSVDELTPYELEALDKKLSKELKCLEEMGEWAKNGLTLRDKIGFYAMALKRMEEWQDGRACRLDQPCTWAQFRKIISEEVRMICHDQ